MKLKAIAFSFTLIASLCVSSMSQICLGATLTQQKALRKLRVLFIGNSYTYFNDLPALFAQLAEAGQQAKVETAMMAPGGTRLQDHWEQADNLRTLHSGKWDFVVLQDQSTMGASYYVNGNPRVVTDKFFEPYAKKWAAEIHKAGAWPVFYLTWARKATPEDQTELNYAYIHAARETGSLVAPAGIAWGLVRQRHPNIELFYKDGSHPSPAGSYLSACAMYATIFHRNPAGLPSKISGVPVNLDTEQLEPDKTGVLVDLPQDEAKALQLAAWDAWQKLSRHGGYFEVAPVSPPGVAPLPKGQRLTPETLEGCWSGTILFYPTGPADMTLQLRREGAEWKAHLDLTFHYSDFRDESIYVSDLQIGDEQMSFRDPESWQSWKSDSQNGFDVHFAGVLTDTGRLQGTAEMDSPDPHALLHWLGTWQVQRLPASTPNAHSVGSTIRTTFIRSLCANCVLDFEDAQVRKNGQSGLRPISRLLFQ